MSIKNLFNKKSVNISNNSLDAEEYKDVESLDYAIEYEKTKERFVPEIDWENPEQFARYGLAERYYKEAIQNVYKTYPYDGSLYEKQKWHNDNSDLSNYIFDKVYPRQNGYVIIGYDYGSSTVPAQDGYSNTDREEYIFFNGTYNQGNKHDLSKNREYNLKLDGEEGATVEFYLKKENLLGSNKQVIFDLWNSSSEGTGQYGRFKIEIHPGIPGEEGKLYLDISSGSEGVVSAEIGSNLDFVNSWHHYGISFKNTGSQLQISLFVDGDLSERILTGSNIGRVYGNVKAHIGSLIAPSSGTLSQKGWGKLSGSLDEFRYWKKERTDKEIYLNYNVAIGAGVNTDDSNTDLGVYFKFNEGLYSSDSINSYDKIVLDYSGRTSNGTWEGFSLGSRVEDSGMVLSGLVKKEFKDPIVYGTHESVTSLIKEYEEKGNLHDLENNSSLYRTLPDWMVNADTESGKPTEELLQILSVIFDDFHNKISTLPDVKDIKYYQDNPLPFNAKLIENTGLEVIDILNNSTMLETFLDRSENIQYDEKIHKIKNYIYQNIYNNLLSIYRSKGTEKSFRNLIRCFGINENILKINMYSNGQEFSIKERFKTEIIKKGILDFNNQELFEATVYQKEEAGNTNSTGSIPGNSSLQDFGFTLESEVYFPRKTKFGDEGYFSTPFLSSSIMGIHESQDGTWPITDNASLQVYAVRTGVESEDVYFKIVSPSLSIDLESEIFRDVYAENKWNLAVKIKPDVYPYGSFISGSSPAEYILEFYGVNHNQDIKQESFLLTQNITLSDAQNFLGADKGIYLGAQRQNFSGSVIDKTDLQFSNLRYWNTYLPNEIIDLHSKDSLNYGANDSQFKIAMQHLKLQNPNQFPEEDISQTDTISLHWNYLENINSNGIVSDFSSGSIEMLATNSFSSLTEKQFTGKVDLNTIQDIRYIKEKYVNIAAQQNPEVLTSEDLIEILGEYEDYNVEDNKVVEHYFILEKSMYSTISKDMISWLGTVKDFNNLIGDPFYRYQSSYKEMEKLRHAYFSNVENQPDFEKFVDFYKWIDSSISVMIEQLIPISMNYSPGVTNMVESHVLERNKYRHKLPTIEFPGEPPMGVIKGINELTYDWAVGHAPVDGNENKNCLWWSKKYERPDEQTKAIFSTISTDLNRKFKSVYNISLAASGIIRTDVNNNADIFINNLILFGTGGYSVRIEDAIPEIDFCQDEDG